jgi:hypothetical protein
MYKNTHKIISCGVILFLLFFANVIFAKESNQLCRRKIIRELKAQQNNYYQQKFFNFPLNELKELTKKYFEKEKKIRFCFETYNQLFYTTYETVMGYTEYEYDANGISSGTRYRQSKIRVTIIVSFYQNEEAKYSIETIKRYSTNHNPKGTLVEKFKIKYLLEFLNKKINGKWSPNTFLKQEIESYNSSVKSERKKIIEGREY